MYHPSISICIPVYNTEEYLEFCLESVANQTFSDYEIVLVNDGSSGVNSEGKNCKEIVKHFHKKHRKIKITYLENSKNLGLFETRRNAIYHSSGEYILTLDSDDFLSPDALVLLSVEAKKNNPDIIQGQILGGQFLNNAISGDYKDFILDKNQKFEFNHIGILNETEVFDYCFEKYKISLVLLAKMIRKELLLEVFNQIPMTRCNLAEDMLSLFFVFTKAKKYVGIPNKIYYYRQSTGMTSSKSITTLNQWEMTCSAASAYTIILTKINENKELYSQNSIEVIQRMAKRKIADALFSLHTQVTPSLRPQARQMLNEYWGKGLVDRIENQMKEEMKNKSFEK